jgi:hypothetical protein
VFADRIESMAGRTQSDPGTLLGHVIAHEIGHLLMGTSTHSPIGLMRERWSDDEVRRRNPIDWRLTRSDAKNARFGLLERSRRLGESAAVGGSRTTATRRLASEGVTLRLAATTGWRLHGIHGNCAEADSVRKFRRSFIARFARESVNLLVRYVQLVFARLASIEGQQDVDDSILRLRGQEVPHSGLRCPPVVPQSPAHRM